MPLKVVNYLFVVLLASSAFAVHSFAMDEASLKSTYSSTLKPFMAQHAKSFTFETYDGLALSAVYIENPNAKKTIVILNGRSETWLKYVEVFYDLYQQGYSIYSYDHRGQGLSPRLSTFSPQVGHVHHFSDYLSDLDYFVQDVVVPGTKPGQELYLLAHSMGGAIAAGYLSEFEHPFKKAVLSCPMLEINTAPYPEFVARAIVDAYILAGKGDHYAKGMTDYDPNILYTNSMTTGSENRFWIEHESFKENPTSILGGPSSQWVLQNIKGSRKIRAEMGNIDIPFLMFQAGKDKIVKPNGEEIGCNNAGENCFLIRFPDSEHEILMEVDSIRNSAFEKINQFFK